MTHLPKIYKRASYSHVATFEKLEDRRVLQGGPIMLDPNLSVRQEVGELVTPISMAFLASSDFLVLEKNTGRVQRIVDGALHSTVLDLPVNFGSERGLLGIAMHPNFANDPSVYLYWTESTTGADTDVLSETALLGNRVDRYMWDGAMLTHAQNLLNLRAIQQDGAAVPPDQGDEGQIERGNHDGGVLRFGPDGKLYVMVGDLGRRGQLQNLPSGPTDTGLGTTVPDDQFGGPEPDDAHLAGVVLRLNADGTAPSDNPFFAYGASVGGEVGTNIQQIFSYGIRNSFGMAFDPKSGDLWTQENGEDAFDELNRVTPGQNSGWIQFAGPAERIDEFKEIETTSLHHEDSPNLQQLRWSPENIADSPEEALSRLFVLPGSEYSDPEFSWKHVLAPAGIGFLDSNALGKQFAGDLFVGFSTTDTLGGPLFRFNLTGNRRNVATDDARLEDRVADNLDFHEMTESESLLIGRDFGVITDVQTGPNGNLFVVSLDQGAVYEIFRVGKENQRAVFGTRLSGDEEVPPRDTRATGNIQLKLSKDGTQLDYKINVSKIENVVAVHLHLGAEGMNGDVVASLYGPVAPGGGRENGRLVRGTITAADLEGPLAGQPLSTLIDQIEMGQIYVNVHTDDGAGAANTGQGDFADGEIRGQVRLRSSQGDDEGDDDEDDDNNEDRDVAFATRLSGDEEVPPRDTRATGNVEFKLNENGAELRYQVNVSKIENVVAVHLHLGAEGTNGDVVASLYGPVAPGGGRENGRLVRGIITAADLEGPLAGQPLSSLIDQIEMGQIYVNVHTDDGAGAANTGQGDFADGEIRGQVRLRSGPDAADVDSVFAHWKRESLTPDWSAERGTGTFCSADSAK